MNFYGWFYQIMFYVLEFVFNISVHIVIETLIDVKVNFY